MISASRDQTVKFWDLDTGFYYHTLTDHSDWVRCLAVRQSDGGLLATAGNDQSIYVYDVGSALGGNKTRKRISELNGHDHVIESVAFVTTASPVLRKANKMEKEHVPVIRRNTSPQPLVNPRMKNRVLIIW